MDKGDVEGEGEGEEREKRREGEKERGRGDIMKARKESREGKQKDNI